MNPRLLFWVPAILRTMLVLSGAGLAWFFLGRTIGLVVGLVSMCGLVMLQLSICG